MPSPIFKCVKVERDMAASGLDNAKSYLDKALAEVQNCQINVDALQKKLEIFDKWILENPDV